MSPHLTLRALLEVNRMFIAEQREINAALIATFLGVALGGRDTGSGRQLSMRELAGQVGLPPTTVSRHVRYLGPGIREGEEGLGLVVTLPPTSIQREGDSGGWFGRSGRGERRELPRSWSLSGAAGPVAG